MCVLIKDVSSEPGFSDRTTLATDFFFLSKFFLGMLYRGDLSWSTSRYVQYCIPACLLTFSSNAHTSTPGESPTGPCLEFRTRETGSRTFRWFPLGLCTFHRPTGRLDALRRDEECKTAGRSCSCNAQLQSDCGTSHHTRSMV